MWKSRIIGLGYVLGLVAAGALILGPIAARVDYMIGFVLIGAALVLGIIAVLCGLIGVLWSLLSSPRDELGRSFRTLIIAALVVLIPVLMVVPGVQKGYPPIHDITTDMDNPPQFVAVLPLRQGLNSTDYSAKFVGEGMGGADSGKHYSDVQKDHFPDIQPVVLPVAMEDAYAKALAAAQAQGWEIVEEAPNTGRIEATATTMWMGFKDDVVIRLLSEGAMQTRIDVRSTSRVGMGDMGANALRVRAYLAALQG